MVHYSSHSTYCEGGAKNPLKGTSMKFLVYARNASFVYLQGVKILGSYVMAYINIPYYRGGFIYNWFNIVYNSKTYIKCQDTIYRVACLE